MERLVDRLFSLRGTRALVTGGNSGIGLAIAQALSGAGCASSEYQRAENGNAAIKAFGSTPCTPEGKCRTSIPPLA